MTEPQETSGEDRKAVEQFGQWLDGLGFSESAIIYSDSEFALRLRRVLNLARASLAQAHPSPERAPDDEVREVERVIVDFVQRPKWRAPEASDPPENSLDWRAGYEACQDNLREALRSWWDAAVERPNGDAADAIDFALGHADASDALDFLDDWRSDRADQWPAYVQWLGVQRAGKAAAIAALARSDVPGEG